MSDLTWLLSDYPYECAGTGDGETFYLGRVCNGKVKPLELPEREGAIREYVKKMNRHDMDRVVTSLNIGNRYGKMAVADWVRVAPLREVVLWVWRNRWSRND